MRLINSSSPLAASPSLRCFQEIMPVSDKLLILLQIRRINPLADFLPWNDSPSDIHVSAKYRKNCYPHRLCLMGKYGKFLVCPHECCICPPHPGIRRVLPSACVHLEIGQNHSIYNIQLYLILQQYLESGLEMAHQTMHVKRIKHNGASMP